MVDRSAPILMGKHNPDGWPLEDLARALRKEIHIKQSLIDKDSRPVAIKVHNNNQKILKLLGAIEELQKDSLAALATLGSDQGPTGTARIGINSNSGG